MSNMPMNRRWRYYINYHQDILARIKLSNIKIEGMRLGTVEAWASERSSWGLVPLGGSNIHLRDAWPDEEFISITKEYAELILSYE